MSSNEALPVPSPSRVERSRRVRSWIAAALALGAAVLPGVSPSEGDAQEATGTVLRIACVAPRGSAWHRVFTAWSNSLREATGGRLSLTIQAGGASANEQDFVRRIGANELDGAALSSLGFAALGRAGSTERPVLVLQAPGLFTEYAAVDRARTALDADLRAGFRDAGVDLIGWSDLGRGRLFSTHPITTPADLRAAHLWQPANEPLSAALLTQLGGAHPVALPLGQVGAAITDHRVDTVVASPMAVSALGWAGPNRLTHVSSTPTSVLVGGTVIASADIAALPADVQEHLRRTGTQAHETLQRTLRRDDDRAYETLTTRQGLTPFALGADAEWRTLATQTRERLVTEHVLPRALLDRATR
jgi:TRAP-type C4-dicarboxylate transport system substrate-binding protein